MSETATLGQLDAPLQFTDLRVGDSWWSEKREIREEDVVSFARLTGDQNPLHLDPEYAQATPFGQQIAHGLLGLSLVAGLGSRSPAVETVVFLNIREWKFLKPVYFGDTVCVRTEVVELTERGRRRGLVVWKQSLVNQRGETVQEGYFETLVARPVVRAEKGTLSNGSALARNLRSIPR